MKSKIFSILFGLGLFLTNSPPSLSQYLNAPILEDYVRRSQIVGEGILNHSLFIRPLSITSSNLYSLDSSIFFNSKSNQIFHAVPLPFLSTIAYNTHRPYGWGNKGMIPNVGLQSYLSGGVFLKLSVLEIQLQPEFVYAQNLSFQGFSGDFPTSVIQDRFFYWNNGDNPERFGNASISRIWWGQSSVTLNFGSLAFGVSTQNINWGPGKWNNLIFSSNAEGFPHLTMHTKKPIKSPIGNFEGQLIMGRLENSGIGPSQDEFLNARYFKPFNGDWRYLNGLHLTYNPSFLKNFFIGFSRTFQQYNQFKGNEFKDWFPIFEVFQKKTLFSNGNSVAYDSKGQDQQVAVSFRYFSKKGKFEVYSEFGRRDHAFDWRDLILSPEHARAYLFGFQKLVTLPETDKYLQISGEITHQQESVNRFIRYPGLIGNQTWHTHGLARGFVNRGEALGVGHGVGSNVQMLEISIVEGINKKGLIFERLENHKDFYYRAFGNDNNSGVDPWVDFSLGLLWDHQIGNLIVSTRSQVTHALNYQWQTAPSISNEFNSGTNLWSFFGQVNLIYHFGK